MLSIPSHLCNKHSFDENKEYKQCVHGQLQETEGKPWLHEESLVNFSYNIQWILINSLQAISKVKSAIRGHKNCRLDDLDMMTSENWLLI